MTDEEKVLAKYPDARHMHHPRINDKHYIGNYTNANPYGMGDTEDESWADAAKKLSTD